MIRAAMLALALAAGATTAETEAAAAAAATTGTIASTGAARGDEVVVRHDGRPYPIAELPEELGDAPRAAARAWAAWCVENEYRMELDEAGRVMLVTPNKSKKASKLMRLAEKTTKRFDELLPPPAPATEGAAPLPEAPEDAPDGEGGDGEDRDRDGDGDGGAGEEGATDGDDWFLPETQWGTGTTPLDTETAVLFVLRDPRDQAKLLDALAAKHDYLAGWARGAKDLIGFVLESPLVGAYLENAPILEEWRAENELVHRLTELLFLRRFGRQPWWIQQGVAWNLEHDLEKGMYCFPYRNEFVYAVEHDAWPDSVRNLYKRKGKEVAPLDLDVLVKWNRGSFQSVAAWTSFGAAHYLMHEQHDAFPAFLMDLRAYRDQHERKDNGDGTWTRIIDYEVPRDALLERMQARFGADVLEDAGAYLGKGKAK